DPGVLKFNHQRHLFKGDLPGPAGPPISLQCHDCHRPAGNEQPWRFGSESESRTAPPTTSLPRGELMAPIAYASHCAACHRIKLPESLASALRGDGTVARGELPHATPAVIRSYLRGQLFASPRTPEAVEQEIQAIERLLYGPQGEHGPSCVKCHVL